MILRRIPFLLFALCLTAVVWPQAAAAQTADATAAQTADATAAQTADAGERHELTLRLRYPDGRPAGGVVVSLTRLPDWTPVAWQPGRDDCWTDERGECRWLVVSGLYELLFEEGFAPDELTLAAAGGHGLHGLGVYLDQDFTVGLVLADPETGGAGDVLFFDQTPDEAQPLFRIPELADLVGGQPAAPAPTERLAAAAPAATAAPATAAPATATSQPAADGGWNWPLAALALALLAAGLFFVLRQPAGRELEQAASNSAAALDAAAFQEAAAMRDEAEA
jgi:hypothetical protein